MMWIVVERVQQQSPMSMTHTVQGTAGCRCMLPTLSNSSINVWFLVPVLLKYKTWMYLLQCIWHSSCHTVNSSCQWYSVTKRVCLLRGFIQRQVGFDKQHRPVIYACLRQAACVDTTVTDTIVHMTHLFENAKRTMTEDASTWVLVVDCTGQ